ncbi:MAG: DUF262 domain-containing protein, partial [Planctomycetota bacterium]
MTIDRYEGDMNVVGDDSDDEIRAIQFDISSFPADITVAGYLQKWNAKQLEIPAFQREYVWDQVRASKLIESLLLGLPVPGVFLYKERGTNKLLVVDGQQRIMSIIRFMENDFDGKPFRLKKLESRFNGYSYKGLDQADKNNFDLAVLRATVVQQLDPQDDSS